MLAECLMLAYTFFKIGIMGFGGGYAMLSMIMSESLRFGVTIQQLADLNALDMVVPGPIAINAATYVGYLSQGIWGAVAATIGVSLPSLIIVSVVMRFLDAYKGNRIMDGVLSGVKPAAVGLIAAAAMTIASGILLVDPAVATGIVGVTLFGNLSVFLAGIFLVTAIANIRFQVNPILLTVLAGIAGAIWA